MPFTIEAIGVVDVSFAEIVLLKKFPVPTSAPFESKNIKYILKIAGCKLVFLKVTTNQSCFSTYCCISIISIVPDDLLSNCPLIVTVTGSEDSFISCAGAGVGAGVDAGVGAAVGAGVGAAVGAAVGALVGAAVGALVGAAVGALVGAAVGALVGAAVGALVGAIVGAIVGAAAVVTSAFVVLCAAGFVVVLAFVVAVVVALVAAVVVAVVSVALEVSSPAPHPDRDTVNNAAINKAIAFFTQIPPIFCFYAG